jgi:6-phosphogluconate dehydrogenase
MNRILVLITLSDSGIEIIKSTPGLPKKEMEFVNQWKQENVLESFFISVSKKDAVLIFQNVDETKTKELIEILPYFPYMEKIEYHNLNKQF